MVSTNLQIVKINNPFDRKVGREIIQLPYVLETVQSIADKIDLMPGVDYKASVNGKIIEGDWNGVIPNENDIVVFVPAIEDPISAIIAIITTIAAAIPAATSIAFWGISWGSIYASVIITLGGMLINALFGPKMDKPDAREQDKPTGGGWHPASAQTQGRAIQKVYGKIRLYGNVIVAFTKPAVDNPTHQFLYTLIGLGNGPIEGIEDIKINDRLIDGYTLISDQLRYGFVSQEVMKGFEKVKTEISINAIVTYNSPQEWTTHGDYFDELDINVVFPRGVHVNGAGYTISYKVEIRKHGYSSWTTVYDGDTDDLAIPAFHSYVGGTRLHDTNVVRATHTYSSCDRGFRYDVRLSKTSADKDSASYGDMVQLESVREVIDEELFYPKTALVGIRALATNEIGGTIKFSCICKGSLVRVYDGSWSIEWSNNPAWVLWDILTQPVISGGSIDVLDPDTLAADDLIAWFKMNDNAANTTVVEEINNHDGIHAVRNTEDISVIGKKDTALDFVRVSSDSIRPPNADDNVVLDLTGDLSVGMWVKLDDLDSNLFDNRFFYGTVEWGYHLQTLEDGTILFACGDGVHNQNLGCICYSTEKISINEWVHILVTKENTKIKFYINGLFAGADSVGYSTIGYHASYKARWIGTAAHTLTWTAVGFGDEQYTDGIIDNIKVWNRALTRDEIRREYLSSPSFAIERYDGINPSRLDTTKFKEWADWCDEFIDLTTYVDSQGSTLHRHICEGSYTIDSVNDEVTFTEVRPYYDGTIHSTEPNRLKVGDFVKPYYLPNAYGFNWPEYDQTDEDYHYLFDDSQAADEIVMYGDATDNYAVTDSIEITSSLDNGTYTISAVTYSPSPTGKTTIQITPIPSVRLDRGTVSIPTGKNVEHQLNLNTYEVIEIDGDVIKIKAISLDHDTTNHNTQTGVFVTREKRITFDGQFEENTSVWEAALQVCEMGRAMLVWDGMNLTVAINKSGTPIQMFAMGNIHAKTFEETFLPESERAAELEIHYLDKDQDFNRNVFSVINPNILHPVNKITLNLAGTVRGSQAERMANFRLLQNQYLMRTVRFSVDIEALACTVGDLIYLQHDIPNWGEIGELGEKYSGGGRIIASTNVTNATVTVDGDLDFDPAIGVETYEMMVRLANDTIETKEITAYNSSTRIVTLDGVFTGTPARGDVWAVGKQNLVTKTYRILTLEKDADQRIKVTAIQDETEVYAND